MQEIIKKRRIRLSEEELAKVFMIYGVVSYRELAKMLSMDVSHLYKQLNGQKPIQDWLYKQLDEILHF